MPSLVGYTASKKSIFQYGGKDHENMHKIVKNFTSEDHFDAFAVFSYLQLVYWRKYGEDSQEYANGEKMMKFFVAGLSAEYRDKRKVALCLNTALDISKYGRKLCIPYLQELIDT